MPKYREVTLSPSRRRFLMAAAIVPVMLCLPRKAHAASTIHELEGDVFINNRRASTSSRIRSGDHIVVSHGGRLVFSLGGDAFLMREGSALEIAGRGIASGLRLLTGGLLAVFEKRRTQTHLVTHVATIGIRGTAVYLNSEPHRLYTCTCYGHTDLRVGHHVEDIQSTHHNAHEIAPDDAGSMAMNTMAVVEHTDDELRMLEAYVGRKPLFDM